MALLIVWLFSAVVCGGARGQETPSPHRFDGNGSFSNFPDCCHGAVGECLSFLNPFGLFMVFLNKVTKILCGIFCSLGPVQLDVLHQHCGCLQFCCLFWNWPWPHPMVHSGWALQPGPPACCHCSCWFLQLVCQFFSGHVLPVCWGKTAFI